MSIVCCSKVKCHIGYNINIVVYRVLQETRKSEIILKEVKKMYLQTFVIQSRNYIILYVIKSAKVTSLEINVPLRWCPFVRIVSFHGLVTFIIGLSWKITLLKDVRFLFL